MPRDGLDLASPRSIHIVGIGGAGMSAIATVLRQQGHTVSGTDLKESHVLDRLRADGVNARVGHDAANLPESLDAVVISTAVREDNPEVVGARTRGMPVLRRAEALAAIAAQRQTLAVAGSHGKTTTSSMLALMLREAELHPSFIIGGDVNEVGTNAAWDRGDFMVVEADESDGTFLELAPFGAIVTNVEADHLDHYGGFDALRGSFRTFVEGVAGPRVVCIDDPEAARLAQEVSTTTYGFADGADVQIVDYSGARGASTFTLRSATTTIGPVTLPSPGRHNASNAAAAAALALAVGAAPVGIERAIARFGGVARRFQFRGEVDGVTLVDDYAHLPSEVAAAIAAALEGAWNRVLVVYQPHRYTRTASLWREFADSFEGADQLVLTDIFAAGETPQPGVSGRLVVQAVLDAHPATRVTWVPHRAEVLGVVRRIARPGDLVLTLGAGDLTSLPDEWLAVRGLEAES
ncbi:MAG: UDP-N-acetylmuramate--L-alanine ligase [Acidimicrobiia bacterium]